MATRKYIGMADYYKGVAEVEGTLNKQNKTPRAKIGKIIIDKKVKNGSILSRAIRKIMSGYYK